MGSYFLDEQLGLLGKIGCAICLIGSVIIVLHAPPDKEVESVEEILNLALQPGMFQGGGGGVQISRQRLTQCPKASYSTAHLSPSSPSL